MGDGARGRFGLEPGRRSLTQRGRSAPPSAASRPPSRASPFEPEDPAGKSCNARPGDAGARPRRPPPRRTWLRSRRRRSRARRLANRRASPDRPAPAARRGPAARPPPPPAPPRAPPPPPRTTSPAPPPPRAPPRPHEVPTEAGPNAKARCRLQEFPREKLVDPDSQRAVIRKLLVRAEIVGESAVHRRADGRDAARKQQALRLENSLFAALQDWLRLHVRDQTHRRLEQQPIGRAVGIATDAAAVRVLRLRVDSRRGEGRRVRHARVAATFVDECRTATGGPIKLGPVRLAALDGLVCPVAHSQPPLGGLERAGMFLKPPRDLIYAPCPAKVGAESGEPVIDDVRVRVIETRKHGRAGQPHNARSGTAQAHDLRSAAGDHSTTADRKMAVRLETRTPERANTAAGQNQLCFELFFQARLD